MTATDRDCHVGRPSGRTPGFSPKPQAPQQRRRACPGGCVRLKLNPSGLESPPASILVHARLARPRPAAGDGRQGQDQIRRSAGESLRCVQRGDPKGSNPWCSLVAALQEHSEGAVQISAMRWQGAGLAFHARSRYRLHSGHQTSIAQCMRHRSDVNANRSRVLACFDACPKHTLDIPNQCPLVLRARLTQACAMRRVAPSGDATRG
jgi:hypothetical protein